MKKNLPVTGREIEVSDNTNILSITDAKGHITYCNEDFIKISGFNPQELMGESHNIVRHPEMPPAAFADLWQYMHAKKPWMGIVKNRCKNGDHYYVQAFATPITENGKLVECQSVRSKPKRDCVERAENLYKLINAGKSHPVAKKTIPLLVQIFLTLCITISPIAFAAFKGWSLTAWMGAGLAGLGLGFLLMSLILNPLSRIVKKSRQIIDNKLMQYVFTGRIDDFGQIDLALQMLTAEMGAIVGRMSDMSKNQAVNAETTLSNMKKSNIAAQQQSAEAGQIAAGIEEMSASMKEIAINASDAANVASSAVDKAQAAHGSITKLNDYSTAIGNVISLINSIAEQTNLLALNATIEAARAGEAGKGFAVVANEVKELASQTAKATEEVSLKVKGIQEATGGSMEAIREINEVVQKINHYQGSIAAAVEEQSAVTNEMSRNITIINSSTMETSVALSETEGLSQKMSEEVGVSQRLANEFRSIIRKLRGDSHQDAA